jgi:hypothetical protein
MSGPQDSLGESRRLRIELKELRLVSASASKPAVRILWSLLVFLAFEFELFAEKFRITECTMSKLVLVLLVPR